MFEGQTDIHYINPDGTPNLANIQTNVACHYYPAGVATIDGTNIADSGWALFLLMFTQASWLLLYGGDRQFVTGRPITAIGDGMVPVSQGATNVVGLGSQLA